MSAAKGRLKDGAAPARPAARPPMDEQRAWMLIHGAAQAIGSFDTAQPARFRLDSGGHLRSCSTARANLIWEPGEGWRVLGAEGRARAMLDLYLPISSATAERPMTIAHLGQSLDGFIATCSGDSAFVTGPENILHLHRMRALCDAVLVGAGTVSADNPRLTTRLVPGRNPVRVILDPGCRLPPSLSVFTDRQARTLRVCAAGSAAARGAADDERLEVTADEHTGLNLAQLVRALRERGYQRLFIEGGGVTVSSFLRAGLVDRLHLAIAPLLIGEGRAAVRLHAAACVHQGMHLSHRVYRNGEDILLDCDLRRADARGPQRSGAS